MSTTPTPWYDDPREGFPTKRDSWWDAWWPLVFLAIIVLIATVGFLVSYRTDNTDKKIDHCHALGGFVDYDHNSWCVRSDRTIITDWDSL